MTQKIRKEIYIDSEQDERLKKLSKMLGISEDEFIERAISSYPGGGHQNKKSEGSRPSDRRAWLKELEFMKSRIAREGLERMPRQSREELYDEVMSERGLPQHRDTPEEYESSADWNTVMRKARSGYYGQLFSDVPPWNRESMYDERIARLPD